MDEHKKPQSLQVLWNSSSLAGVNAAYLEQLYEGYLRDPDSVDPAWKSYFESLPRVNGATFDTPHSVIRDSFRRLARASHPSPATSTAATGTAAPSTDRQFVALRQLIDAYRAHGHLRAEIDPLGLAERPRVTELLSETYGLADVDQGAVLDSGLPGDLERAPLGAVIAALERIYCGWIGSEYMHITDATERQWIQQRLERDYYQCHYPAEIKRWLLGRITAAEVLERFLHSKYVGQKRFSLEGAESLVPLIDELIQRGGTNGVKEIVIGMAHRGRLNVLINVMGKSPAELFLEFEGKSRGGEGSGDVKYHLGFSSNFATPGGAVHVSLAFNPSHLEIVGPVVEGSVRARQQRRLDRDGRQVIPVLIHGDAAFSGQGVVMETFNMSQSRGYSTKGSVHIVTNNQIGFTTSNQRDARSSLYCTDLAKMVNVPIFHVNSDHPEAVLFVAQMALDYRAVFSKDVVIDLVCYRRHGHSEADEPSVTQPMMYRRIREKKTTRDLYGQALVSEGVIGADQVDELAEEYRRAIDAGECNVPNLIKQYEAQDFGLVDWTPYLHGDFAQVVDTQVAVETIRSLAERLAVLPEGFKLHASVSKLLENRLKMAAGALPIDWGFAETMAYATTINDGYAVRLSGQDSGRGTFFHRHATIYNQDNDEVYVPLRHLAEGQANFLVTNSLLSEEAVLAFEYGYATTDPKTLVIWEAQFGDFANNAQVVIDQFISAGEQKWNRLCGLVMFLPHGYEGQGPEHSSARLERYLQLCAEHNIQVCVPTTPAQIFHLLRRQMLRSCRKPLIVMTPKSLLRHKLAISALEDLTEGGFKEVIPEIDSIDPVQVTRVIMCCGKVYYDLLEKRRQDSLEDVAIIRLEQLYPFPRDALKRELARYRKAGHYVWCQEEPKNQGVWYSSQHHIRALLRKRDDLQYAGREPSAAPAVGYPLLHIKQLCALVDDAFRI